MTRASQAAAYIAERNYVIPEDVKNVIYPCTHHRILLNSRARAAKVTVDDMIGRIMKEQG